MSRDLQASIGTIEQQWFRIWSSWQHGQLMAERNDFGLKLGLLALLAKASEQAPEHHLR
jgi:hypothetical protein